MQEYKNIVLNIVSLDEPENGRNNKLLRELRGISDFEKRVHLYQYNNTNDSAKIDERFIISDFKDVKYIENNKQTSIFLANEKVAKYLLNKFHSLEKIPYRV
jgi:phosphopantetheine adenylyltransferase